MSQGDGRNGKVGKTNTCVSHPTTLLASTTPINFRYFVPYFTAVCSFVLQEMKSRSGRIGDFYWVIGCSSGGREEKVPQQSRPSPLPPPPHARAHYLLLLCCW